VGADRRASSVPRGRGDEDRIWGSEGGEGNQGSDRGQVASEVRDQRTGTQGNHDPDPPRSSETIIQRIEHTVHLPIYHAKQRIFITSPLKRKIIRAGRRGGKTTGASGLAVERFLGPPKTNRVLYAVPTAEQIARFWQEVCLALAEPIEFGVYKKYESDKIIELPGTEQRIRAKTAWNADTLRGDYGDLIVLDEFQLMNEDALQEVVYPMLIDNNGDLVLIYTPPSLHSRSTSKATDKRHAAKLFKLHENDPRWLCLHFTSRDNPYISEEGIAEVSADMTELAKRQEIDAEDITEIPGALWTLKMLDDLRYSNGLPKEALPLVRIVVAVDPTGSSTNEAGIVAAAMGADGHGYVLADKSLLTPKPRVWAAEAVWLYWDLKADCIVGERNYGGDMVKGTIDTVDENVNYHDVDATRGKLVRAEPIAALYEKGIIHHVGTFEKLEEEQCSYVPILSKRSPNRMDALVWALTELFPAALRLTLAEFVNAQMDEQAKVQQSSLIKPATNAKTEKCPNCGSTAINRRGPISICGSCGQQWGNVATPPATGGRSGL
jgi:hypothetical protein